MQNTVKAKLSQQKIKECNHSLELKNEIIGELKRNLDITNDVLEKHRLTKKIEEAEEEREQIVQTLMKLENALRKLEQVGVRGPGSMEVLKYFFSYNRRDTEFVLNLAQKLRVAGVDIWLDQLDILGGQRWDRAIEQALETCEGIIVVLSPESVVSNNVMDEVAYALEEGKLVVPVLLHTCNIPFRLRRVQYIDFTADYNRGFSQLLRALRIDQP